ncbi:MAG TPA: VCBS repeat-containing protein [Planctomycetes bacterium]|nr:VCBS repeat-containing protein [Planctomycetota bacterium]
MRRCCVSLALLAILTASSLGQVAPLPLLGQINDPSMSFALVGAAVTTLDDVDGDGASDFAYTTGGTLGVVASAVTVVSGKTLTPLYTIAGGIPGALEVGLVLGELDDIDGDGIGDFGSFDRTALGGLNSYVLVVRSGSTGLPIYSIPSNQLLSSIHLLDDLNGDQVREFLIAYRPLGVDIRDGATGARLEAIANDAVSLSFGNWSTGILGDLNADGFADFYVSTSLPSSPFSSNPSMGRVDVFVSTPPAGRYVNIKTLISVNHVIHLGKASDLDGDSLDDYIMLTLPMPGIAGLGTLEARSTATDALIWLASPPPGGGYLSAYSQPPVAVPDIDGDGQYDVAVIVSETPPGGGFLGTKILVYSGHDGRLLFEAPGSADPSASSNAWVGSSRIQIGDFNGDGLSDILEADPHFAGGTGRVSLHAGTTVFEPEAARGNVANSSGNGFRDVLQVEVAGSPSSTSGGAPRTRVFPAGVNLGIWIDSQPGNASLQPAYAIFGRVVPGADHSTYTMPFGIGEMCFAPEIFDPLGSELLFTLLNSFGGWTTVLPAASPANPGQLTLVANTGPIPFPVTFWLQGFLVDAAKPWPYLSVTNAIRVVVR